MDRDEFVTKFKQNLDEWNAEIDQLEGRAKQAGTRVRDESRELIAELRQKRDAIGERIHEVRQSIGDAWHDIREGLDEAGEDLRAAIADARRRLRRDDAE